MTPHLVKWHDKYADNGLTIIEVFNGPADRQFGLDLDEIETHVRTEHLAYAVLYDNDGMLCDRYGVRGYPSGYLIGRDGKVVWETCPNGNQRRVEREIRRALTAANN